MNLSMSGLPNKEITFCIVVMNRLHQLEQTLLQNIRDNAGYENLEFLLLNYNSQDHLDSWVRENCAGLIQSGRLSYYHTTEPQEFSHSHSKNIAFKLSTGDIACNINADHFTGPDFAGYVNEAFTRDENIVLTTIDFHRTKSNYFPPKDVFGKVCVKKSDFLRVGGFDEGMKGYGFEDWDFVNRLELIGIKRIFLEDPAWLQFLSHEENRFTLDPAQLEGIFIRYCTPATSEILLLFKNGTFKKGMVLNTSTIRAEEPAYAFSRKPGHFEFAKDASGFSEGTWHSDPHSVSVNLEWQDAPPLLLHIRAIGHRKALLADRSEMTYFYIENNETVQSILEFEYMYPNRSLLESNLKNQKARVNEDGFGKAILTRNFQTDQPITI